MREIFEKIYNEIVEILTEDMGFDSEKVLSSNTLADAGLRNENVISLLTLLDEKFGLGAIVGPGDFNDGFIQEKGIKTFDEKIPSFLELRNGQDVNECSDFILLEALVLMVRSWQVKNAG